MFLTLRICTCGQLSTRRFLRQIRYTDPVLNHMSRAPYWQLATGFRDVEVLVTSWPSWRSSVAKPQAPRSSSPSCLIRLVYKSLHKLVDNVRRNVLTCFSAPPQKRKHRVVCSLRGGPAAVQPGIVLAFVSVSSQVPLP